MDKIRATVGSIIVNHEPERMERGEIDELSDQHNDMVHQLASLTVSSSASVSLSGYDRSNPVPTQPVPTYAGVLSAPKAVIFKPNDVRSLPRLTGSADVDVAEVWSHFRVVVGFRAKAVTPHDEKFADNPALSICPLICDGPCLMLYQQRMSGRIDWRANVVNAENTNKPCSYPHVSAYVSECHRSTQRPRRTNLSVMGSVRPDFNKKDNCVAQLEAGMQIPSLYLVFSSRRVQSSGSVEDYPVPAITVDTVTDVFVVSHAWLMSHPTLRSVTIQPFPPTAVALRAANGSSLNVLGFVAF